MKKQTDPSIKAHLLRGAFYLLLLLAVCVIPFALAQRNSVRQNSRSQGASAQSQPLTIPDRVQTPDVSQWTIAASYPLAIEQPAVTSDGTYAYSAGGLTGSGGTNAFYRYDPVTNSWAGLPFVPALSLYAARAVYAANTNKIYLFGGYNGSTVLNTTYIYDIATFSWSTGAPMPAARYLSNAAYYPGNGKIYVIGGLGSAFTEQSTRGNTTPLPIFGIPRGHRYLQ